MRKARDTNQHGSILTLCTNNPPEGIARGWIPVYDAYVARRVHPCALLREGQTRREAGAQKA